jgi:microcystin-dependent protein
MANTALRRGSQEDGNSDYFTGCPIGGGFIWYGLPTKIPSNCRVCDNSTLAISSFAKLYENLDGAWGESGGNMNIPDLRGRFPRGVDSGAGNDPDRLTRTGPNMGQNTADTVGSVQDDINKSHDHFVATTIGGGEILNSDLSATTRIARNGGGSGLYQGYQLKASTGSADVGQTSATVGSESRPKNANVYFVIRVE